MLRIARTAALVCCDREIGGMTDVSNGPIPAVGRECQNGRKWYIVPCLSSEKPAVVPLTADPGSPGALSTSLEALDVSGRTFPVGLLDAVVVDRLPDSGSSSREQRMSVDPEVVTVCSVLTSRVLIFQMGI